MYSSSILKAALLKQYPEVQSSKFRERSVAYLKKIRPEHDWPLIESEAKELLTGIPDAFVINEEENEVVLFEIEVHHPVHKRAWRVLDAESFFVQWEVGFSVLTIDCYGRILPLDMVQLLAHDFRPRATR